MGKRVQPWLKLDNAAKIYPAAMRRTWMAMFRFGIYLTEPVEEDILKRALACTLPRFPGFAVHLRRGMFWFYLEHSDALPDVQQDVGNPCVRMNFSENKHFMFRVRYHDCRIALEVFHVLTDGTGGLCFLKTLAAEYLRLKYGAEIPRDTEILDCAESPRAQELEDAFFRYAGRATLPRSEKDAYHIDGVDEPADVVHITTGSIPVAQVLSRAREKGVTLTEYLTAVLILSADALQRREIKKESRMKPVKVCVPVNLRAIFPSDTLRNFSLFVNPGIDPRLGKYSFDEVLKEVHCQMGLGLSEKSLRARFATNVQSEKNIVLRMTPLFLKNFVMRLVFERTGDRKTSTLLTNLGRVTLPEEMARYVTRMDVVVGPLSRNRVISAALSYGDTLYYSFTRTIKSSALEREFFRNLVRLGIPVKVESNNQWQEEN